MKPRWQAKVSAKDEVFDVCVIGGGATGAGCALDAQLRGGTGIQALMRVRERYPALPVIMVSAARSEDAAIDAFHLGVTDYIPKKRGYGVFVSPHYLYPHDQAWRFGGAVEKMMLEGKEFYRPDPLGREGFAGSGADWLDRYKPFIEDGKTVVVSPHKVWGPQTNDLVLQLRKRRVNRVVLAGMLANLCVESHLRELIEQGFEVAVVKDATAAPRHPELGDGYQAAVVNFHR